MEFWSSVEIDRLADQAFDITRRLAEPYLNEAFAKSSLSELDAKLRYVPIVMHDDAKENYPARSKLRKKQRIYDCAPQLDYDIFINGTRKDQLNEYLRGVVEATPYLAEFGAVPEQIKEFEHILANASRALLS